MAPKKLVAPFYTQIYNIFVYSRSYFLLPMSEPHIQRESDKLSFFLLPPLPPSTYNSSVSRQDT